MSASIDSKASYARYASWHASCNEENHDGIFPPPMTIRHAPGKRVITSSPYENAFRLLADRTTDAVLLYQDERPIYANAGVERLTGYTQGEILGMRLWDFVHPEHRDMVRTRGLARQRGIAVPRRYPFKLVDRTGREKWVDFSGELIGAPRRPVGFGIAREVPERTVREWGFNETDQRYRSLFDNTAEGLFQATPDGRFLSVNPSLVRMLGYDSENDLLTHVTDIARDLPMEPGDRDGVLGKPDAQGIIRNHELRCRRKDGTGTWISITGKASFDAEGSIAFIDGCVQDIGERKRLEQQLIQSQKMEAVGRLAGGIAHDFNNLLTVMMGNCEIIQETLRDKEKGYLELQGIRSAVMFASALTRRLLAFSRQQIPCLRILDVNGLIRNLELMLERLIGENIRLVTVLDSAPARVKADPSQLEQVVMNLAVNARDAMPNGGQLTLWTKNLHASDIEEIIEADLKPGQYVLVRVSDTGLGMSRETLDHLFEPFYTTKELGRGTGLGLSTVYGIVRQSEGSISVTSTPGKGTCFSIALPLIDDEPTPELQSLTVATSGGSEAVLVVEDDAPVRKLTAATLRSAGYTVLESGDGSQALDVIAEPGLGVDLVITDVIMPRVGGGRLKEAIRQRDPGMPVLFISGYTESDDAFRDDPADRTGFLSKPFSRDELLQKIRSMLDRA
jgi:two-component system cell cycle sensor histidine kinase/response regulator CckA